MIPRVDGVCGSVHRIAVVEYGQQRGWDELQVRVG